MKWNCHNFGWLEDRPVAINVAILAIIFCLSVNESGYLYLHWSNHESNESQIRKFDHNFLTQCLSRDPEWFMEDHGSSPRGSQKFTEVHGSSRKFTGKFTEVHGSSRKFTEVHWEVHGSSLWSSQKFTVPHQELRMRSGFARTKKKLHTVKNRE